MLTVVSVAYPFSTVGPDAVGGAEQVLWHLDRALTRAGHRSIVIASRRSTCNGELIGLDAPGPSADGAIAAAHRSWIIGIAAVLAREAVDVVHLHGVDCFHYLPQPADVPIIVTLHVWPNRYGGALGEINRPDLHLVCVSFAQRAACPVAARCRTIPNGVDLDAFAAANDQRTRDIVLLGRVAPEKGFHLAMDAAQAAGRPVVLAGTVFPYASHVAYFDRLIAPRLSPSIRFVGPVGPVARRALLSRAAAVAIPSLLPETSSLVAMEALASGTPVVAFRSPALEELIEDGRNGYLVRDVDEMQRAFTMVDRLSSDECRRSAECRCSVERTAADYLRLYEELASPARHRTAAVHTTCSAAP